MIHTLSDRNLEKIQQMIDDAVAESLVEISNRLRETAEANKMAPEHVAINAMCAGLTVVANELTAEAVLLKMRK